MNCKKNYDAKTPAAANYHVYRLNPEYTGDSPDNKVTIVFCNAVQGTWIDKLEKQGKLPDVFRDKLQGAPQCIFLIPKHELERMFGVKEPTAEQLYDLNRNKFERRVLIDDYDDPAKRKPHVYIHKDRTSGEIMSEHYVFSVNGLINAKILIEEIATDKPEFIEEIPEEDLL